MKLHRQNLEPLLVFGRTVLKIGLTLSLLTALYLAYNKLESRKLPESSCQKELKICGIWHDHLRYQLDLMTEQDVRLKTENSALKDRLRLYEDAPSESEP